MATLWNNLYYIRLTLLLKEKKCLKYVVFTLIKFILNKHKRAAQRFKCTNQYI